MTSLRVIVYVKEGTVIRTESVIMDSFNYIVMIGKQLCKTQRR